MTDDLETSVVFHEQKLFITIDMIENFDVVAIDLNRDTPSEHVTNTQVSYNVVACQCNDGFECEKEEVSQNSVVSICVRSLTPNVEIADIRALSLLQRGVARSLITDGVADDLTEVMLSDSGNGKLAVVRMQLVSGFFDLPENITAQGTCALTFGSYAVNNGKDRLLRSFGFVSGRDLLEGGEASFDVELTLMDAAKESFSAAVHISHFMAIFVGIMLIAIL